MLSRETLDPCCTYRSWGTIKRVQKVDKLTGYFDGTAQEREKHDTSQHPWVYMRRV